MTPKRRKEIEELIPVVGNLFTDALKECLETIDMLKGKTMADNAAPILSWEHFLTVLIEDVARSPLIERQFKERCAGIDALKAHDAALRARITELDTENDRLISVNAKILAEGSDLYATIQRLTEERDAAQRELQTFKTVTESNVEQLSGQLSALRAELETTKAKSQLRHELAKDLASTADELSVRLKEITVERDNQYEFNAEQIAKYAALETAHEESRVKLEAAELDTKRLSWLEENPEANEPRIVYHPPDGLITWRCDCEETDTLREAIDLAIKHREIDAAMQPAQTEEPTK